MKMAGRSTSTIALNPLYIVWENAEGRHGGSVRIMPTVGRTMTNEHFLRPDRRRAASAAR